MSGIPMECAGGPWDGKLMVVERPEVRILTHSPHVSFAATEITPIKYHEGIYQMRFKIHKPVMGANGGYYFDWLGWQK